MNKPILLVIVAVLSLVACTPQDDHSAKIAASQARNDTPQYGGSLNVITVYRTLSALSWDPADWTWKHNHDAGAVREQLISGDLSKSVHNGGAYPFTSDAYLPEQALRGELAESWEWQTSDKGKPILIFHLRKGVMFTALPGVMAAREFDAEDVVFSFNLVANSPKKIATYFDHIERVEARDKYTAVFHFSEYNAEWAYRYGYGYYSSIVPREMANVDLKNWRNVVGTGPFLMADYIQGNSHSYTKNPNYWDSEQFGGKDYALPFVDEMRYRIIMDEATSFTAIRTGKVDIIESIRWIAVDHLKETTPELLWSRRLIETGTFLSMRVDTKPFDDVRVRRALNMAINHREMVDLFFGGHAELFAYPQHPTYGNYFQTLEEMPESVQELFDYKPEKAKQLLAEAGYPDGFTFKVQVCACNPSHTDMIPLIDGYLNKVGVKLEIELLEYASHLSLMTSRKNAAGYLLSSGHTNPFSTLRKNFGTGQTWNPSQYSDPAFDEKIRQMYLMEDERERELLVRDMTAEILAQAPYLWLPVQYVYSAWWPWVKNYGGELRSGAARPAPIYARIWIDHELKKSMGFE